MGGKTPRISGVSVMSIYTNVNINKIKSNEYQQKLEQANPRAYRWSKNIETFDKKDDSKEKVDTPYEYVYYLLNSSDLSIINKFDREAMENLSPKEKMLEEIYILENLKRIYPEVVKPNGSTYASMLKKTKEAYRNKLSDKEINDHLQTRTIETLEAQSKDNKYFVMYSDPRKKQIAPEMNVILKYLLKPTDGNKQVLIKLATKITKAAKDKLRETDDLYTKESKKYREFIKLCRNYKDIFSFVDPIYDSL